LAYYGSCSLDVTTLQKCNVINIKRYGKYFLLQKYITHTLIYGICVLKHDGNLQNNF